MLLSLLVSVQVSPPSFDRYKPPFAFSIMAYTFSGLEGATATPTMPHTPFGNPFLDVMFVQVSPPSVLFQSPLPSPPLSRLYGVRISRQVPAYITSGLPYSIDSSLAPVWLFTYKTRRQFFPPSVVLYTPRISFGPNRCPITAAHTTSGLRGCTSMRIICLPSFSPMFFQLRPPSSLRHMPPSPSLTLPRMVF